MIASSAALTAIKPQPADALPGVRLSDGGLQFTREGLLQLFENIPVAISITTGPDHRFLYTNSRYRRALLPGSGDPAGRAIADVFGRSIGSDIYRLREQVFREGRILTGSELPVGIDGGGAATYFDVTYFPVLNDTGATAGILTFAFDVTDKVEARREAEKRAEEESARAEEASIQRERLALAVDATGLGIWEWDVVANATHWSKRQKEIWGLEPDADVTYETWRDSLHPEDRDKVLEAVQTTLDPASGGEQRLEHRILRPSGGVRWISSRGRMIYDGAGRPLRLIGTVLDITSRKLADEELKAAFAVREALLREVNHRIKNSLQLVSSMLALQGGRSDSPEVRQVVQDAQLRLQVVAAVHERLYRSQDIRSVELAGFLATLCRDVERSGVRPDGAISVKVRADPVTVGNDRAIPVALILNELLTNAIKYAYPERRGVIEVALRDLSNGKARLTVSDHGAGLPEDFDERQRSSLGFRIVTGLVRQIHGELAIVRRSPGAAFEITFDVD
jgi:PAS domain S-box-containing protein